MLRIKDLHVSVDKKHILRGISLEVASGSTHALMGPNGSGKSTLAYSLIGNPLCIINAGSIIFEGQNITLLTPDERARRGIFLSFQQPPMILGVSVFAFLKEIYRACTGNVMEMESFMLLIDQYVSLLGMRKELLSRALNEGFSGGEKRQFEMLQILLLRPRCIILDEIDSGLDMDALRLVAAAIGHLRSANPDLVVIVITHYQHILQYVIPDQIHILCEGHIVHSGNYELVHELTQKGYDAYRYAKV